MVSHHNTFGLHCGVWVIDCESRQGYKVSVVMAPCERWSWGEGEMAGESMVGWRGRGNLDAYQAQGRKGWEML
jgi:hypothetical protein